MEEEKWREAKKKELMDEYQQKKADQIFDKEVLIHRFRDSSRNRLSKGS